MWIEGVKRNGRPLVNFFILTYNLTGIGVSRVFLAMIQVKLLSRLNIISSFYGVFEFLGSLFPIVLRAYFWELLEFLTEHSGIRKSNFW